MHLGVHHTQSMLDVDVFAMLDYYGLNSLFLTTTPDDDCRIRVRLYAKPCDWGSELFTIHSISELFVSNENFSLH
jgi:hypothetical protein